MCLDALCFAAERGGETKRDETGANLLLNASADERTNKICKQPNVVWREKFERILVKFHSSATTADDVGEEKGRKIDPQTQ